MTCEYKCPEFQENDNCRAFKEYGERVIKCEIPAKLRGRCPIIAVLHQTRSWAQGYAEYKVMVAQLRKAANRQ